MNTHIQPGTLLLSVTELQDPNFMHSIVLIGEHSDKGAYGLVLNQTTGLTSGQIFADREGLSDTSFPVHTGGPVGRGTLPVLHTAPHVVARSLDPPSADDPLPTPHPGVPPPLQH